MLLKYFPLVLIFWGTLFAKNGMFLEIGSHNFLKNDQPLIFKETAPLVASLGYIYDFTTYLGMGFQTGYVEYTQQQIVLKGLPLFLKEWALEGLWNPVVINLGKFRLSTKIGSLRRYARFFSKTTKTKAKHRENIIGIGIDAFVTNTLSLSIAYFARMSKEKHYNPDAFSTQRPYHQRVVYTLRYSFPS